MNILSTPQLHPCTSCQMCAAACPANAISIRLNDDGFYRPILNKEACIECGLCVKFCYKFDDAVTITTAEQLDNGLLYAASAKDDETVGKTTSGGIADLLAHKLVEEGYKCIGVVYDLDSHRAKHKIADSKSDLERFRGSKYIQAYSFDAFRRLVGDCKTDKFALFGTPCQIYAIDKFLRFKGLRDQSLLIDLYCHGCPSMNIWKKYVEDMTVSFPKREIDEVTFRSKIKGWGSFYYVEVVVDGVRKIINSRRKNEFYDLFFSDVALNDACADCQLRSTLQYTDIRLGDFWGKQYAMNTRGVSAVSIATKRGEKLFKAVDKQLLFKKQHEYSEFLPYQSYGKRYRVNEKLRAKVMAQIADPNFSLMEAVRTIHRSQSFTTWIKRIIKNMILLFPQSLVIRIKRLYY